MLGQACFPFWCRALVQEHSQLGCPRLQLRPPVGQHRGRTDNEGGLLDTLRLHQLRQHSNDLHGLAQALQPQR